ncbi:hypothetical protein LCGC14_2498210, partial [marine sediment metagenome]
YSFNVVTYDTKCKNNLYFYGVGGCYANNVVSDCDNPLKGLMDDVDGAVFVQVMRENADGTRQLKMLRAGRFPPPGALYIDDLKDAIISVNFQNTAYRWGSDETVATHMIEGENASLLTNDLNWTTDADDDDFVTLQGFEFRVRLIDSLLVWDTSLNLYKKASVQEVLSGDSSSISYGYVDVTDYGATGDGSTDDTAALVAAFTAARVNREDVFFPSGTYLTDMMRPGNVGGFIGESMINTIIKLNDNQDTHLLRLNNGGYVRVENLTLDGNRDNNASTSYCFATDTGLGYTFKRVIFKNGNDGAIRVTTTNVITFDDCWFEYSAVGAYIGGAGALGSEQINFYNCIFQCNDTYGLYYHSTLTGATITIQGCWFENGATTPTDFIIIEGQGALITNNKFNVAGATNSAIRIKSGSQYFMLLNNQIHQSDPTYGYVFDSGAYNGMSFGNRGFVTDNDGRNYIINNASGDVFKRSGRLVENEISFDIDDTTPSVKLGNFFVIG